MGQSRKRTGADGKPRFTAYYTDLRGERQSAGTFASKKLADKAWQKAEADVGAGKLGDPRRGRQTFRRYVEGEWLPNHPMELRTRENYESRLVRYILPEFGPMKMVEILPSRVRDWVAKLQRQEVGPPTIKYCKAILDAIFTTALNDQVTYLHAGKGVKTAPVVAKPRTIITPEHFELIYKALPSDDLRLLVETDIESGARWGELTELRVRDLNTSTGVVTISRVVQQLNQPVARGGSKFIVKAYPKDREHRSFRLSAAVVAKIKRHVESRGLRRDDLIFHAPATSEPRRRVPATLPDPATLGLTEPNKAGRQYQHGTINAYSSGGCRCRPCKDAYAHYRARRRAAGKDQPRKPRTLNTDGHIPRDWFRRQVWLPALLDADLDFHVRIHDLRHAHASWLLAGGADLQVVKERLGHGSIKTTERYLHTLPEADNTALNALDRVRNRSEEPAA